MINLRCAEFTVNLITTLMVYFFTISIAGAFRAWVASKMGDDTAKDAGFLTLNPFVHADLWGTILVCLTSFGWSKYIPINPHNIDGSVRSLGIRTGWRIPKLICAYLSDTAIYFGLALISLVTLIMIFGPFILYVAPAMLINRGMSHLILAHAFPSYSSLTIVVGFMLMVITYLTIALGVLDGIINSCHLALALCSDHSPELEMHYGYLILILPIIIIMLFAASLRFLVTKSIILCGWLIAHILGLA